MSLADFDQLFAEADRAQPAIPVAAAGGDDATVLAALRTGCDRGWVIPIVTGPEADIRRTAREAGIALDGFTILDSEEPAVTAVDQVRQGRARFLMKGRIATPELLRAMLDSYKGLRTGRVICQVVLVMLTSKRRCFLLADTGICIRPTLEQKKDIIQSAIGVAQALSEPLPRVAVLAASETPTESMPETLEALQLQQQQQDGAIEGCLVQGPLSFDLAFDASAGDKKHIRGPVTGTADVMLFPDLCSANLTVKAIMYTADCRFGGILCGAACPVVFMSRADSTATRLNSLALALRVAQ